VLLSADAVWFVGERKQNNLPLLDEPRNASGLGSAWRCCGQGAREVVFILIENVKLRIEHVQEDGGFDW
jgi:hypothetical protein